MVRSLALVPVMLCAAAIVSAQTPAQERPASPPAGQTPAVQAPSKPTMPAPAGEHAAMPMMHKVTYAGCVKPGTTPGTWILDNAEMTPAAKPGESTVGTSGMMKATLNLHTKPETDLKGHANHKVEVTGTVAPAKAGDSSSAPAAAKEESTTASKAPRQEFTVESVKMVSATCP